MVHYSHSTVPSLCVQVLPVSSDRLYVLHCAKVHEVGGAVSLMVELFGVGQDQLVMHGGRVADTWEGKHPQSRDASVTFRQKPK